MTLALLHTPRACAYKFSGTCSRTCKGRHVPHQPGIPLARAIDHRPPSNFSFFWVVLQPSSSWPIPTTRITCHVAAFQGIQVTESTAIPRTWPHFLSPKLQPTLRLSSLQLQYYSTYPYDTARFHRQITLLLESTQATPEANDFTQSPRRPSAHQQPHLHDA